MGTKKQPGRFDCYGDAGEDEPIFVLRANDPAAIAAIHAWMQARHLHNFIDGAKLIEREKARLQSAQEVIHEMTAWQEAQKHQKSLSLMDRSLKDYIAL